MRLIILITGPLWILSAAALLSQTPDIWFDDTRIAEIQVGLICHIEVTGTEPAPGTVLGEISHISNDPPISWHGTRIPAVLDFSFGIKSRAVEGRDIMDVEVLTYHPPFGPNNATVERWKTDIPAGSLTTRAYSFDFPYEMVTGEWVFEARTNNQLLYRVVFEVVDPSQAPLQTKICNGTVFMS